MNPVCVTVKWALRNARAEILESGEEEVSVDALSAKWLEKHKFPNAALYDDYASYELWSNDVRLSAGTVLFCAPKHFNFVDPELTLAVEEDVIVVSAKAYARMVEIVCEDGGVVFEDNYFDLNADTRRIRILRGEGTKFFVRSVCDIH